MGYLMECQSSFMRTLRDFDIPILNAVEQPAQDCFQIFNQMPAVATESKGFLTKLVLW